MLPTEATKCSVNTMADVSHQYEQYAGKLLARNKCVAKHFSVERYDGFADTDALKAFPMSIARSARRARTSQDYRNPGRYYSVFPQRHG